MPDSVCYTVNAGEVLEDETEADAGAEVEISTFDLFEFINFVC